MANPRKPPGKALGHRRHDFIVLEGGNETPVPKPPTGLLVSSERRWAAFWRSGVAEVIDPAADLPRLERWIKDSDEFTRVSRDVDRIGRMVLGSMGQPVLNPLYVLLRDLDERLRRAETEFGMTPKARLALGLALSEVTLNRQRIERHTPPPIADPGRRQAILAAIEQVEPDEQ